MYLDKVKFKELNASRIVSAEIKEDRSVYVKNILGEERKFHFDESSKKVTTHSIRREITQLNCKDNFSTLIRRDMAIHLLQKMERKSQKIEEKKILAENKRKEMEKIEQELKG